MAAQDYYGVVQQLYISYFGRPADYFGLRNFADQLEAMDAPTDYEELAAAVEAGDNAGLTALVQSFNSSEESIALYGNDNSQLGMSRFVAAIYQNVLGREADPEGFDFWTKALANGEVTKANAAASITAAALKLEGEDAQTVQNKLAVATAFTDSLDTPSKFNAYAGEDAAAAARGLLQGVNADTNVDAYQATIDTTIDSIVNVSVPGETYTLTTSIDSFLGGAGNDNFVATITDTSNPIGALDVVDGGAGRDTLSIADSTTTGAALSLAGLTVRNVENLVVSSNRAYSAFDISTTGVANASLTSAATTGTSTITAADTTDVTVAVAGTASATITGGKAVVVSGTGTNTVNGAALTGVTVNGGTAKINNVDGADVESTLTSVTLNGVTGTDNAVVGDGVTMVNLTNIKAPAAAAAQTKVTVTNATDGGYTLNLNANAANVNVTAANATKVAVTAATASTITLAAVNATSATVAGAGNLNLSLTGSAALASLDASAATGNVTVTGNTATLTAYKGGSAIDTISLGNATSAVKYNVDAGAGNDVVTLAGQIAAGSVINLGAGNDSLLGTGNLVLASTTTATTIIDGGEGFDTVSAGLLNAANAAQFKNFDALDLSGAANLDVNLVTGSTITGLTLSGGAGGATLTNVKAGVGLTVAGENTGTSTINVANATATDNTFGITFNGVAATAAPAAASVKAGIVALNGVEAVSIASNGAANTWNSVTLADDALKTVTITGDKNLDLSFTGTIGAATTGNGLSMIDGSAATGKLAINLAAGTTADPAISYNVASAGLTVKGGSAADTITLSGFATVDAGAGNDVIVVGKAGGILTGGAGADTFNVSAATATVVAGTATAVVTTITDLTAGDKINFGLTLTAADFAKTQLALGAGVTTLDGAFAQAGAATEAVTWFQYGTDTYVVADAGDAGFNTGDIVVKLTGLIDLSAATVGTDGIITL